MAKILNVVGHRFGRLVAVSRSSVKRAGSPGTVSRWLCKCDCGNETEAALSSLRQGTTRSCGCLQSEVTTRRSTKHGHSPAGAMSGTYNSWRAMIDRCTNPGNDAFSYYGGRGITVCESWKTFEGFLADMGERAAGKTLDRIDFDEGYYPANCRWATHKVQANNRRKWTRRSPKVVNNRRALGERIANSRLKEHQIPEIRQAVANGESMLSVANRLGVSHHAISCVVHGETWKHVPLAITA